MNPKFPVVTSTHPRALLRIADQAGQAVADRKMTSHSAAASAYPRGHLRRVELGGPTMKTNISTRRMGSTTVLVTSAAAHCIGTVTSCELRAYAAMTRT